MAGIDVGDGRGQRRSLDAQINMLPMIDLLLVTVSFLLLTAVWSSMKSLEASAQVPGNRGDSPPGTPEPRLHLSVKDEMHFTISVQQGSTVLDSREVEDRAVAVGPPVLDGLRYEGLSRSLAEQWAHYGVHRSLEDPARDVLVLHTSDEIRYETVVRVMDAAMSVSRPGASRASAFRIAFAAK